MPRSVPCGRAHNRSVAARPASRRALPDDLMLAFQPPGDACGRRSAAGLSVTTIGLAGTGAGIEVVFQGYGNGCSKAACARGGWGTRRRVSAGGGWTGRPGCSPDRAQLFRRRRGHAADNMFDDGHPGVRTDEIDHHAQNHHREYQAAFVVADIPPKDADREDDDRYGQNSRQDVDEFAGIQFPSSFAPWAGR